MKEEKAIMGEKKVKDPGQVNIRMSPAVHAEIETYLQNIGPAMRKAIESASVLTNGKPHAVLLHSFIAHAIRQALKKENPQSVGRTFGSEIEKTVFGYDDETGKHVLGIADQNHIHFENGEPWNIKVIGLSVLRDEGHNHHSCVRWLKENSDRLAAHYADVGIPADEVSDWNRKQGKYRAASKLARG